MKKYTYREILDRINALKEFFPTVRLVCPQSCSVVEIIEKDGSYTIEHSTNCFHIWKSSQQCINCTSARAFQTDSKCSKCEILDDTIFQITSTPVDVEGTVLVLEFATLISHDLCDADSNNLFNTIASNISKATAKMLMDAETHAFNRRYLSEHLPFILLKSHQTRTGSAAMVQIQNFFDICNSSGKMAEPGLVCMLHDILVHSFSDTCDTFIIRYSDDTFIVINTSLALSDFKEIMHSVESETSPAHILFNNGQIPFAINISCTDIFSEDIKDEASLIEKLTKNIK